MKYVLYIDYRSSSRPLSYEYRPLKAKSLAFAILEADAIHDLDTMYLIRIMAMCGKVEKVESNVKMVPYMAVLEKRSVKWVTYDGSPHTVKYFISKFANWFD